MDTGLVPFLSQTMDIFDVLAKRHTYRGLFKGQPVPRADLEKIVQAGLLAPSGKNVQTTEFVVIDDVELLRRIGLMHTMPAMQTARAMIACVVDRQPDAVYEGYSFQVEDCAAAVENMLLALTALGYAAVWIDGWLRLQDRAEKIGQLLNIPSKKKIRILLPIGVPVDTPISPEKRPFSQRVRFNRYG